MQTTKLSSIWILTLLLTTPVLAAPPCPPDSVRVGTVCVDKYEASVWQVPIGIDSKKSSTALIKKIERGKVTLADLQESGATRLDCFNFGSGFDFPSGNWRFHNTFAVSIAGVLPTDCLTWFQANQACALSGKRLLTNAEWQTAAVGTPDGRPCNVGNGGMALTGAAEGCVSRWGCLTW